MGEEGRGLRRWTLLGLLTTLSLASCATDDPEADAFFNRGWILPKTLDQPYEKPPATEDSVPVKT